MVFATLKPPLRYGALVYDPNSREAFVDGKSVLLHPKEGPLFELLIEAAQGPLYSDTSSVVIDGELIQKINIQGAKDSIGTLRSRVDEIRQRFRSAGVKEENVIEPAVRYNPVLRENERGYRLNPSLAVPEVERQAAAKAVFNQASKRVTAKVFTPENASKRTAAIEGFVLHLDKETITCKGSEHAPAKLVPQAARLAGLLMLNPGRVFTREELMAYLDPAGGIKAKSVDKYVSRCNEAFARFLDEGRVIQSIGEVGYRLNIARLAGPRRAADPKGPPPQKPGARQG